MTPIFMAVLISAVVISMVIAIILIGHIRRQKAEKLLSDFYGVAAEFNFFVSRREAMGRRVIMEPVVKRIVLQLHYKDDVKPLALNFYDRATDSAYEMQQRAAKATEWQVLLADRLRNAGYITGRCIRSFECYDILN